MTITPEGNIVATGSVQGDFELDSGGDSDGYVRMYSPDGTHMDCTNPRTILGHNFGIVSDKNGDLYMRVIHKHVR